MVCVNSLPSRCFKSNQEEEEPERIFKVNGPRPVSDPELAKPQYGTSKLPMVLRTKSDRIADKATRANRTQHLLAELVRFNEAEKQNKNSNDVLLNKGRVFSKRASMKEDLKALFNSSNENIYVIYHKTDPVPKTTQSTSATSNLDSLSHDEIHRPKISKQFKRELMQDEEHLIVDKIANVQPNQTPKTIQSPKVQSDLRTQSTASVKKSTEPTHSVASELSNLKENTLVELPSEAKSNSGNNGLSSERRKQETLSNRQIEKNTKSGNKIVNSVESSTPTNKSTHNARMSNKEKVRKSVKPIKKDSEVNQIQTNMSIMPQPPQQLKRKNINNVSTLRELYEPKSS